MSDLFNYLYKKYTVVLEYNKLCGNEYGKYIFNILRHSGNYLGWMSDYYDNNMIFHMKYNADKNMNNIIIIGVQKGNIEYDIQGLKIIIRYEDKKNKICVILGDLSGVGCNDDCYNIVFKYNTQNRLALYMNTFSKKVDIDSDDYYNARYIKN